MNSDPSLDHAPTESTTPPGAVLAWLDGSNLESKTGTAVGVITTDADGWPHPAQLSAGEILLSPDGQVRLLTHIQSATTANLRRDGRLVLMLAADGANNELRFEVTERPPLNDPPLATFSGRLTVARQHRSPYAQVTSGVGYTLNDRQGTLARWQRQIDGLRKLDATY